MSKYFKFTLSVISVFALTTLAFGWPWNIDMYYQPYLKSWQNILLPPENSVPVTGKEEFLPKELAEQKLKNPLSRTPESIKRGQYLYDIFCAVCHGKTAKGDGPVSEKFIPPPDLTMEYYIKIKDGYYYSIIKDGGALMPAYGDRLNSEEIWEIVIYIRELQKDGKTE